MQHELLFSYETPPTAKDHRIRVQASRRAHSLNHYASLPIYFSTRSWVQMSNLLHHTNSLLLLLRHCNHHQVHLSSYSLITTATITVSKKSTAWDSLAMQVLQQRRREYYLNRRDRHRDLHQQRAYSTMLSIYSYQQPQILLSWMASYHY